LRAEVWREDSDHEMDEEDLLEIEPTMNFFSSDDDDEDDGGNYGADDDV
jgi:hypothetical protein